MIGRKGKSMPIDSLSMNEIVEQVIKEINIKKEYHKADDLHGIFEDVEDAIINAKRTQKIVREMTLDFRESIIRNIRNKTKENANLFAEAAVKETGMGNVPDKIKKHYLVADKTPGTEDLVTTAWSGDRGLTLVEQGPFGVIGAVCPSTNPSETVICNTIGMLAAGNTVVFCTHPAAAHVSNMAVDMVNRASVEIGGPDHIATALYKPTFEMSQKIFTHKDVSLLVATGGPGVVTAVLSSGKRAMGAGAGNPPVLVDETANIRKAARDIVNGCTFDNNLPCFTEKEVVAVDEIADELISYMKKEGCYFASAYEVRKLMDVVFVEKEGKKTLNRQCVGRSARVLLKKIGVEADNNIRCIIFEGDKTNPLIYEELMMPILGIVRVKDIEEGIEMAVWLERGNKHSAHMHSTNIHNLTKFGKAIDTAIFVKNAPSYAGLGYESEGYTTFTICSRTGEGLTSARTFTKSRRCVMRDALCIR